MIVRDTYTRAPSLVSTGATAELTHAVD